MEPINKDDITVTKSYKEFPDDDPGIEYYIRLWSETPRTVEIRETIPEFADIDTVDSHDAGELAWEKDGRELVFRHRIDTDGVKTAYTYTDGLKNNLSEWMGEPEIEVLDGEAAEEADGTVPLDDGDATAPTNGAAAGDGAAADGEDAGGKEATAGQTADGIAAEIHELADRNSGLTNREIAEKVGARVPLVRDVLSDETYGGDDTTADDETTGADALPDGVTASELTDTEQAILETAATSPGLTNAEIAAETGTTVATVRDTRVRYEPDKSADYGGDGTIEDDKSDDGDSDEPAAAEETTSGWSPGEPTTLQKEILETALRDESLSNAEVAETVDARLPLVRDTLDDYDDWTLADLDTETASGYEREEPADASDLTEIQRAILRADAEDGDRTNAAIAEAVGARVPVVRDTRRKYAGEIDVTGATGDEESTAIGEGDESTVAGDDGEPTAAGDDGEAGQATLGSTTEVDADEISEAAEQLSDLEEKLTDTTPMTDDTADTETEDEPAQTDTDEDAAGDEPADDEETAQPPAPETEETDDDTEPKEPELVESGPESEIGQELLDSINGIKETITEASAGGGQYEARIRRLETEVSKLQSYTNALEEFLSDNGTGSQIIEAAREDIDEMQADVQDLKTKRQTHESTLAELQTTAEELEDDLWNNSKTIDKIESTLDTQRSGIDAIQDRVDALDEEIGNVESTLDTRVSNHDDQLDELTDTTETHEQEIDTLEATTAAHTDEIDALTDTTSDHGDEIGDLSETTETHSNEIDEVTETASRNEADIVDISEDVDEVADSLDALADEVDERFDEADADRGSLADQIDDHADQLSELSADIESIGDDVATLESRLADDGDVGGRITDLEDELNEIAQWREQLTSTLMTGGGADGGEE